jgi:hypothetical protein
MKKMLDLNEMLLEPRMINVYGQDIVIDKTMISSEVNVNIEVNTAGEKDAQNQNILMMVQQLQGNAQVISDAPQMIQQLLAQLANNLSLNSIATQLKIGMNTPQQPNPQQVEAVEIEKAHTIAEINKMNAETALKESQAQENHIDSMIKAYGA